MCLSFAYHMYGQDINQLKVLQMKAGNWEYVWHQAYDQADQWLTAAKDLKVDDGTLQLEFYAKRGSSSLSDIGLDQIIISYGDCSLRFNGE